jgi:demethylmenaquinone methyltransferase/2-methoxy-6-polyprenyl-1,4-benzoquinol methylase
MPAPSPGATRPFAQRLFDGLAPRYDLLAEVLSLGQNRRWRAAMVDAVVARPAERVLDVATGTAGVALQLSRRTGAEVVGIDITPEMLAVGARRLENAPGARVRLVAGRAEELPFPDASFDALTFTYLLRYVTDPAATLAECARVVRPGGVVASLEFHVPPPPLWRTLWMAFTWLVLPAAGYLTGGREWYDVGRFLGPSISEHARRFPLANQVRAWHEAGIEDVVVRPMTFGSGVVMSGRRQE